MRFDVGVFTNLTGDHLDYHKTMENYRLAKRRLFDGLDADAAAVVNIDDPVGASMLQACRARAIRYGLNDTADLRARIRSITPAGTQFDLCFERADDARALQLVGRHNVQNALAAAGAAYAMGLPWDRIITGLESVSAVRGRLEAVRWPDTV